MSKTHLINENPTPSNCWLPNGQPGSKLIRGRIRNIQDIEQIEKISPADILLTDTTYDYLSKVAVLFANKPAIRMMNSAIPADGCRDVSYIDYLKGVTAAANLFSTNSNKQAVVAMMAPLLPETLYTAWGGCTAGALCPVNPFLDPKLVINILNSAKATTLVTTQAYGPSAADQIDTIISKVPTLENVWLIDSSNPENDFATALAQQPSDKLNFDPKQNGDSESVYLPTGGTTGVPKLAKLTHQGQLLSAWVGGAIMGASEDEVVGVGMPLFHVGGLLMLSLRSLVLGQTALLLTDAGFRNPGVVEHFWDISREFGMTSLIATPTSAASLLNKTEASHQKHNIRTFTSGGSTVPIELGKQFAAKFDIQLREVWGATEFHGFLGCMPNETKPTFGSVGLRTPFHEVKAFVLDDNNRFIREAAPGETGVICGKGPCVSPGYLLEENNSGFFVSNTSNGEIWGSSGDLGYVDEHGYIWITGRQKDVIIRGGHNIDPRMIEETLATHPAVQLAAAIGYPDESKGELPVAYVQLIAENQASAEELTVFCKDHVAERAAAPVAIFIVDSMPLTAVGKIFKPTLRKWAIEHLIRKTANGINQNFDEQAAIDIGIENGRTSINIKIPDQQETTGFQKELISSLNLYPFTIHFLD